MGRRHGITTLKGEMGLKLEERETEMLGEGLTSLDESCERHSNHEKLLVSDHCFVTKEPSRRGGSEEEVGDGRGVVEDLRMGRCRTDGSNGFVCGRRGYGTLCSSSRPG